MTQLLQYMNQGGIVMYPIAFASLLALTIFIERLLALRKGRILPSHLVSDARALVVKDNFSDAKALVDQDASPMAALLRQIIDKKDEPIPLIKESVEEQGRQESALLEKYVGLLGTIASIAPLLGILGTVTGLISAFQGIYDTGSASPAVVASGVWEALLTTAFGLMVGIPSFLAYRFLLSKIDHLVLLLEKESISFFELVRSKQNL